MLSLTYRNGKGLTMITLTTIGLRNILFIQCLSKVIHHFFHNFSVASWATGTKVDHVDYM